MVKTHCVYYIATQNGACKIDRIEIKVASLNIVVKHVLF